MSERPTVRPVTLARLVEATHLCREAERTTEDVETALDVSHRRARETILEALRIGVLEERDETDTPVYLTARTGEQFLDAVREQNWLVVSEVLERNSPHYSAFLGAVEEVSPASLEVVLSELEDREAHTNRSYNRTSIEVLGDWAERLGRVQRNAFTGTYYPVEASSVPDRFPDVVLSVYDDLEETAGVSLRQRYLPIPQVREHFCERVGCPRATFDAALSRLARQNVGKLELSGAPIDTGAKEAKLGIKEITLAESGGLVSTDHSTDRVMCGVEQFGKRYYYLAVHDRTLEYTPESQA